MNTDSQLINDIQKNKEYWLGQFEGERVQTSFPGSNIDSTVVKKEFGNYNFVFSRELNGLINKIAGDSDQKLHIILMAGLTGLLHKYLLQNEITIITPIDKQDAEAQFINTEIMLKNEYTGNMTFKDIILQTRDLLFKAIEHQNYPLNAILKDCKLQIEEDRNPFTDVALMMENLHNRLYINNKRSNIIFNFKSENNIVECNVDFMLNTYTEESIKRICNKYSLFLSEVLTDINRDLNSVSLLEEDEKADFKNINDTEIKLPDVESVIDLIDSRIMSNPNNVAVEEDEKSITYKELESETNKLLKTLEKKGIERGDVVGLFLENSIETIVSIFAILKLGGTFLPIDTSIPKDRIKYLLEDSNTKLVIAKKDTLKNLQSELPVLIVDSDEYINEKVDQTERYLKISKSEAAYIIYTSGSTGQPKGVVVNHEALLNYIMWAFKTYVNSEITSFPLFSSISFDLTITSIFTPLVSGNKIVVYKQEASENLIEKIVKDNKVNIIKLTPSHLKLIQNSNVSKWIKENNNRIALQKLIVGGENLTAQLASSAYKIFSGKIDIYNEYGPTEATVGCIIKKYAKEIDNNFSFPIGKPIDNMQVYILDSNKEIVFPGKVGELYLAGKSLAKEYLNKQQLTEESFVKIPEISESRLYKTGDIGYWDETGDIVFVGRKDNQVKLNGFRVELEEINNKLLRIEEIQEAVTIVENGEYGESLISYYVAEDDISREEIVAGIKDSLPEYMIPNFFQRIESIPLTRNGKLDVANLPKPDIKLSAEYVAPSNPTEKKLVEIWADVLELEEDKISVKATFIELGGHSLKAVFLISRIEKELGVEFTLNQLFQYETIRRISQLISLLDKNANRETVSEDSNKIVI